MEYYNIPEFQRNNLISLILLLKTLGLNNLLDNIMVQPPHKILVKALEQLYALGTLNSEGILT